MTRINSVDTVRLIAIIAVIAIHTTPFSSLPEIREHSLYYYLDIFINQAARFAVPFFFVISGYFYGAKTLKDGHPIKIAKKMIFRIAILYLSWCVIYLLPYNFSAIFDYGLLGPLKVAYWGLLELKDSPVDSFFQGTKEHLWFLVSLIISIIITAIFVNKKHTSLLVLISIILFIFGVFAKSYSATGFGIDVEFNTRNGPFFGLVLFVSGYILARKEITKCWFRYGLLIFLGGFFLHFVEIYFLTIKYNVSPFQDFVFGTYFMGLGAAVIALSNHKMLCNKWAAKLGKMTLGIYASHFIFVDLLQPLDVVLNNPFWEVLFVILVLVFSIIFTMLLSLSKLTKSIVQ